MRVHRLVGILGAVALSMSLVPWASATAPTARSVAAHPSVGELAGLYAVDAVASDDVWGVGVAGGSTGPLIDHFDGSTWSQVDGPHLRHGILYGVAGTTDDVWAVGTQQNAAHDLRPLAEHWDGTDWEIVPVMPAKPSLHISFQLNGVASLSPSDAWAVGVRFQPISGGQARPVMFHWDGTSWTRVALPRTGPGSNLLGISASGPDDVFAAGFTSDGSALLEHWNGRRWTIKGVLQPPADHAYVLYGISVVSSDDIWTVGSDANESGSGPDTTLTLHWDGQSWTRADSYTNPRRNSELRSVEAFPSGDALATGRLPHTPSAKGQPLAEQWDGTRWNRLHTPWGSRAPAELLGVSGVAPDDVWAVGHDVILHWDGTTWTQVAAPGVAH